MGHGSVVGKGIATTETTTNAHSIANNNRDTFVFTGISVKSLPGADLLTLHSMIDIPNKF